MFLNMVLKDYLFGAVARTMTGLMMVCTEVVSSVTHLRASFDINVTFLM